LDKVSDQEPGACGVQRDKAQIREKDENKKSVLKNSALENSNNNSDLSVSQSILQ
jgi:hypothetical protein